MPGDDTRLPQVWRIPSWQPAALILLAAALIGYDLYGSPGLGALLMTAVIAAAALVAAVFAIRYLLVADGDGIWVRTLLGEKLIEWSDIADIDVTHVRGTTSTVRITRVGGSFVDVPPSLLQPTLPTSAGKALAVVGTVARRLNDLAERSR
jgi:hypothetical protein